MLVFSTLILKIQQTMKRTFAFIAIACIAWLHSLNAQTIQSVSPDSAEIGTTVTVTITGSGTNFTAATGASAVQLRKNGQVMGYPNVQVLSPTVCQAQLNIPMQADTGAWDLQVLDYTTLAGGIFRVFGTPPPPPGLVSCVPNSAYTGQTVLVTLTGTSINFNAATQVRLINGGTTVPSTMLTQVAPNVATARFSFSPLTPTGTYDISVFGTPYSIPNGFTLNQGGGIDVYGYLQGNVYQDFDSNCVKNGLDNGLVNQVVEITPGPYYVNTQSDGSWGFWVNVGNYNVNYVPGSGFQNNCNPSNTLSASLVNGNDTVSGLNFPLKTDPVIDLACYITYGPARPGFSHHWIVMVQNRGTIPTGGELKFLADSICQFANTQPASTLNGDTVIFTVPQISPGGNLNFRVNDAIPPDVNLLGTDICAETWVTPVPGPDISPANNYRRDCQEIRGAYDPNDKRSFGENGEELNGTLPPGDSLIHYHIRFQNTGTDTAFNIYVRDTLDTLLRIPTFRTLGASHPYILNISGRGAVEWTFPNIQLPDSNVNEPGSHGFILYEIKSDPNYPLGTILSNTAHIYFDFNPAVVTNTTSDTVQFLVAIDDPEVFRAVEVFPNPSTGRFRLYGELIGNQRLSLEAVTPDGRTIALFREREFSGFLDQTLDFQGFPAGVYFLRLRGESSQRVFKCVITK